MDVFLHPAVLAGIGLCVGLVGAAVGVGGGFFLVPYLLIVAELPPARAGATSLVSVWVCAASATLGFERERAVNHGVGLAFAAGTIPGALAGAWLVHHLPADVFAILLAALLALGGANLVFLRDRARSEWTRRRILAWGVPASVLVGVASSLTGLGGGVLHVPLMLLVFGMPYLAGVATSQFVIVFTALVGAAAYAAQGQVEWPVAIPLALGSAVGAQFGVRAAKGARTRALRIVLAFVLVAVAARLVVRAFWA